MRKTTFALFALLLLVALFAGTTPVSAQSAQYYAECKACASRLGGSGYIGPFSTPEACEAERKVEIAQGFPIGACMTSTSPPTASPHHTRAKVSIPLLGALGAAAGGAGGFALSHGDSAVVSQNDRDKTVNGTMIGAGVGVVLGTATHLSSLPTAASAGIAGAATYVAVAGYGRDREINGQQDASKTRSDATKAAAVATVTFGALDYVTKSVAPGVRLPKGMGVGVTGREVRFRWLW